MADQRAAVLKLEMENALILTEAFSCAAQLPEAARGPAITRLEALRAAFKESVAAHYDLLQQDRAAASGADIAGILERLSILEEKQSQASLAVVAGNNGNNRITYQLSKLERENQELRSKLLQGQAEVQAAPFQPAPRAPATQAEGVEVVKDDKDATGTAVPSASPATADCFAASSVNIGQQASLATGDEKPQLLERLSHLERAIKDAAPRGPVFFAMMSGPGLLQPGPGLLCRNLRFLCDSKMYDTPDRSSVAVSLEGIRVAQGGGLRFRPDWTYRENPENQYCDGADFMIGLGAGNFAPVGHYEAASGFDYAVDLQTGIFGGVSILDNRKSVFQEKQTLSVSAIELRVSGARVEFLFNGVLKYTGQLRGQHKLYAMANFRKGSAKDIEWLCED